MKKKSIFLWVIMSIFLPVSVLATENVTCDKKTAMQLAKIVSHEVGGRLHKDDAEDMFGKCYVR